jgi:tetratricopeptide (TPR) repeat protein
MPDLVDPPLHSLEPTPRGAVGRWQEAIGMLWASSPLGYPRHGLRVTVRLHGSVVSQRVLWAPPVGMLLALSALSIAGSAAMGALAHLELTVAGFWTPVVSQLALVLLAPSGAALAIAALAWPRVQRVGDDDSDAVPTPDGLPLATVSWAPGRDPVFSDHMDGDRPLVMGSSSTWSWAREGVEVDVVAQAREPARRLPTDPLGDVGLVVVALALYVAVMQAGLLVELSPGRAGAGAQGYEVSPELIARLLQRDLDGEEQGISERVDRPDYDREFQGLFMPAGNDGALSRVSGGQNQGDEVWRGAPPEDPSDPAAPVDGEQAEESLALQTDPRPQDVQAPIPARPDPASTPEDAQEDERLASRARDPMERFVGWGFRDWFDAAASERKLDPRVERQLQAARTRLRLDPDDYGALQVVGHYAYLAENNELCRASYERLTELFPEDSAGYNNLALTYKRDGEYVKEEELYRKALELDPSDPVVLNNLAVNLAHQGRFEEALGLMQLLEELDPDDPYSDLHRAKVYAAMGKKDRAFKYLKRALDGVHGLDTLHHIEFRQDLRLEPLLSELRREPRFERLVREAYGPQADQVLRGPSGGRRG